MSQRLVELMPLAERAYVRLEAQDLLARCLKEDSPEPLRELINELLLQEPPDLDLLRWLMADVHSRWVVLRERLFDTRRQVIGSFQEAYGINLTEFAPPNMLEQFHSLSADRLFDWLGVEQHELGADDALLLRAIFEEAVSLAGELAIDLRLLENLSEYLGDWVAGFSAVAARTVPPTLSSPVAGWAIIL